jgi:MFS family permease
MQAPLLTGRVGEELPDNLAPQADMVSDLTFLTAPAFAVNISIRTPPARRRLPADPAGGTMRGTVSIAYATARTRASASGRSPLPGAGASLVLLLLINLFNYLDRQVLAAVVRPLKGSFFGPDGDLTGAGATLTAVMMWCQQHLGFKPEDALVGLLGTAFMVVYMAGAPVFARLAERASRWMLIGTGVILWSLASGASGMASTFLALLLTRCLVGVGEAAWGPIAPALISDLYPVQQRGRVLAWFYMAIPVGSALGYVIGGWIAGSGIGDWGARAFGANAESWRWAFYVLMPPGLLLGAWCFFVREPQRGAADFIAVPAVPVRWRDYLMFLRTPSYVYCTLGMTAMTFSIGGIAFWMPYYLETRPGAPAASTFIFGLVTVVAGLSGTLLGGRTGDRLRERYAGSYFLVSGAAMLAGFPVFLGVLQAPFPWIWVLIFFTVFFLFFNTGPTNTVLANVTHPSMRPAGFALNILVIHALGDVLSPVVIGLLGDWFQDIGEAFVVVSLMFPVAGALWLAGARHLERDMAALN